MIRRLFGRRLLQATWTVLAGLGLAACSDSPSGPGASYSVGGTVSGLAAGASVVLQDAAAGTATVGANGSFTLATTLASGAAYSVSVKTQPANPVQDCAVANGQGTVGTANVTSVTVTCATPDTRPLQLTLTGPAKAVMGTLAGYKVVEAQGIVLTGTTWTFDGAAGGHAWVYEDNGKVQVWNSPGTHTVRVVATASNGRSGEATFTTSTIGAPLVSHDTGSCALTPDGQARCWGYGNNGALGNGAADNQASPVVVSGLAGSVGLAAGARHECALLAGGTLRCWGDNTVGQLGFAATVSSASNPLPVAVAGVSGAVAVVAGDNHTCVLKADGTVACFGGNVNGELGTGSAGAPSVQPQAVTGLSGVVALSSGGGHFTCALKADGAVLCWGDNALGQLSRGSVGGSSATPVPVLTAAGTPLTGVLALRSGAYHSCAVLDDGRASVVCWGFNDNNQVSPLNDRQPPFTAVSGVDGVVALSLTVGGTCAADRIGGFRCWGSNGSGESDGKGVAGTTVPVPTLFDGLQGLGTQQPTYASGGFAFRCMLTAAGGARCVGRGGEGEMGNGAFATAFSLQNVSAPAGTFWSPAP